MIKRILSLVLIITLVFSLASYANGLSLSAESAVLLDAFSKDILFEKNARTRMPMASTTKIMTALIVLERCKLSDTFKVDEGAVGTEGSSAYLQKGDKLTFEAALYALLLQSANDMANALAIEIAGSTEAFAALMNEKAKELSLSDTSFKNPSGLSAEGHYTTAYDLAMLSAVCLESEDFFRIASTKSATVKIGENDRTFVNHNKLLSLYDGACGVKTGFTKESGRCLVGAAERNGVRLISVTLKASSDWNDHAEMLDFGFSLYREYTLFKENELIFELPVAGEGSFITVSPKGEKSVFLQKGKTVSAMIEAPRLIFAPVKKGQIIGTLIFEADGREIFRTPLLAQSKVA